MIKFLTVSKTEASKYGQDIFCIFYKLFYSCNKIKSLISIYNLIQTNENDKNQISSLRNRFTIFHYIISEIHETQISFKSLSRQVLRMNYDILKNLNYLKCQELINEINNNPLYNEFRNQIGFHHGDLNKHWKKNVFNTKTNTISILKHENESSSDEMYFCSMNFIMDSVMSIYNKTDDEKYQSFSDLAKSSLNIVDELYNGIQKFFDDLYLSYDEECQ